MTTARPFARSSFSSSFWTKQENASAGHIYIKYRAAGLHDPGNTGRKKRSMENITEITEIKGVMIGPGKNFPWGELRFFETEDGKVRAFGKNLPTVPGLLYSLTGIFEKHLKYGEQFLVKSWTVSSYSKAEIINLLTDLPGVGQKTAEAVYDTFGEDTLIIVRTQPDRLKEVPVAHSYIEAILSAFSEKARLTRLYNLLIPYGFTASLCRFLNRQYGERSEVILHSSPYSLCDLPGFTFPNVDAMAVGEGFDRYAQTRVEAGMCYLLKEHEQTGDTSKDSGEVYQELPALLGTKALDLYDLVKESSVISCLRIDGKLRYARTKTLRAERSIAKHVFEISGHHSLSNEQKEELLFYMRSIGLAPDSDQARALALAVTEAFCCITGGAGTGKTTLIKHIVTYFTEYQQQPVMCLAPTGMAAKRISECTGYPASTIHSALGMAADGGRRNVDLSGFCVIVDESSMVDAFIASELLAAHPDRVVWIGDSAQLQSVGPGAVFRDLLDSPYVPSYELRQVYRFSTGSGHILGNAALISSGTVDLQTGSDFRAFLGLTGEALEEKMLSLYIEGINAYGIDNVCLIAPVKDGPAGVKSLNLKARELINPGDTSKPEVSSGKKVFRLGDRVMETRNSGAVVNGDIGYISAVMTKEITISFLSGDTVVYPLGELYHVVHAYALTVHKAQGSEYAMIITCLQDQNRNMLRRSIVYTAFTRGKQEVVFCGSKAALDLAIETDDRDLRKTSLPDAIVYKFTH